MILRKLVLSDVDHLVTYLNVPEVTRYLSSNIPSPYTIEDAEWFITTGSEEKAITKAIEVDGQCVGVIGVYLQQAEYAHNAEIGYWLGRPFWRKGLATKAVTLFVDEIFDTTEIIRIFNPVTEANIASRRVMEKAEFQLEGKLQESVQHHGKLHNEYLYSRLKLSVTNEVIS